MLVALQNAHFNIYYTQKISQINKKSKVNRQSVKTRNPFTLLFYA